MSQLKVEICKIEEVNPIEKADKLEVVKVKGWHCVVSKGQYEVGNIVIYCPPDSIIPDKLIDKYNLEFLKKNGRVGTIKLRGQISQGLILDIDCLSISKKHAIGDDVSKELGIIKYEPPQADYAKTIYRESIKNTFRKFIGGEISFRRFVFKSIGIVKNNVIKKRKIKTNPLFDKYTDIENINNYPNVIEEKEEVVITEKIHGTNVRYAILPLEKYTWIDKLFKKDKNEFCYGSHNVQINWKTGNNCWYGDDVYGKIAERLNLATKIPLGFIFYGEIFGKKIQDLNYGLEDIDIRFFDIKDAETDKYLSFNDFNTMCEILQLKTVPILFKGKITKENVSTYTTGKSTINIKQIKEGCVIKPLIERYDHRCGRVILKSINSEYLLRKDGTEYK